MSEHPDRLRFFVSESTSEAQSREDYDLITVQQGRFASYIERESTIPGTGLSTFINHIALPDGFLIINLSFDTMFNSLLIGYDKDFLDVAKRKYPTFGRGVRVYEKMRKVPPKPGEIWVGIDYDPHDGAEISVVNASVPISRDIVSNSEAIYNELKTAYIREVSSSLVEAGFEILYETSVPIEPIKDVLALKRKEFASDIRDPQKICTTLISGLMKKYGWPFVEEETGRFLEEYQDEIIEKVGSSIYEILSETYSNRKTIFSMADKIKLLYSLTNRK
nr:hypothetical protein [uncultured Desulfobacter sp.]